jgi:hypothetical protein
MSTSGVILHDPTEPFCPRAAMSKDDPCLCGVVKGVRTSERHRVAAEALVLIGELMKNGEFTKANVLNNFAHHLLGFPPKEETNE